MVDRLGGWWTRLAEVLAKRRVPAGFLFGAVVLWLARPTGRTLAVGASVAGVGEALRIWAAGHLNKSREVTTSGPYRWVAHPLYTGSLIMGVGLAIASWSMAVAVLVALYLGTTLTSAVKREEAFLRRTFGDSYDQYRRAGAVDRARRFSLTLVRANREHRAVVGLVVAILLLLLKATYNATFGGQLGGEP